MSACGTANQLDLGFSEASLYHDSAAYGFFSLMWRDANRPQPRQASFNLSLMSEAIEAAPKNTDVWISQAEFSQPRRRIAHFLRVGLCFVDLDTYKTAHSSLLPNTQASAFLLYCNDHGLPAPSLILFSGRGLQVKWLFDKPIPSQALPRWNAVQTQLTRMLKAWGADAKARDAARVLRVVGTTNTRSAETVAPLWVNHSARYDFDWFAQEVLPFARRDPSERAAARTGARGSAIARDTNGLRRFSAAQLWWDRLSDIRRLAKLRGWDTQGVPEGSRDLFLFLSAVALSWQVPASQVRSETAEMAQIYCPSFRREEASNAVSSALARMKMRNEGKRITFNGKGFDPRYRFKTQTLLELLEVEPQEEAQFTTLIGPQVKRQRDRERKRAARRANGMVDREVYRRMAAAMAADRRALAKRLFEEDGLDLGEIANRMNVSVRSVRNYLRQSG